jgi:hypothetical protein
MIHDTGWVPAGYPLGIMGKFFYTKKQAASITLCNGNKSRHSENNGPLKLDLHIMPTPASAFVSLGLTLYPTPRGILILI